MVVQRWMGAGWIDAPAVESWPINTDSCSSNVDPEVIWAAEDAARRLVFDATCGRFPGPIPAAARFFGLCAERAVNLDQAFAYPIVSVDAVVEVDATGTPVELPETAWRWDRPSWLIHHATTSDGALFRANDRYLPHDAPHQWWVEATVGQDPPQPVIMAAEQLACELIKMVVDPENCSLPDSVRSISRQGTTIEFDRTADWATLPLLAQISKPPPAGWGCAPVEYGFDPAHPKRWAEIPWSLIEPGS
jgi:hypothetical protein